MDSKKNPETKAAKWKSAIIDSSAIFQNVFTEDSILLSAVETMISVQCLHSQAFSVPDAFTLLPKLQYVCM